MSTLEAAVELMALSLFPWHDMTEVIFKPLLTSLEVLSALSAHVPPLPTQEVRWHDWPTWTLSGRQEGLS